ncbi:Protein quaking-B [Larimichthys crocea]|uniref:Protein quaking-B n=1 Tax=Larimichthys crocea TaxID=215358 RepID=A0A6G0HY42_LARCR|nr:Protein quaking-B [Larimichthys crocea]
MVGETEVKERPKSNPDYLMQLMNDRKVMSSLPNFSGIFTHLERLLDEEIGRVRKDMYNDTVNGGMFNGRDMEELPEAIGPVAQLQEKLYVPVKEYPDFNFVGRILGPRGLTAKQLEGRDRLQDYGARKGLHERQEEGGDEPREAQLGAPQRGPPRPDHGGGHTQPGQDQTPAGHQRGQETSRARC